MGSRSGLETLPLWRRALRSAAAPVALIIVTAAGCIALAVLSSAHRADLLALDNERRLLSRAIVERQAQVLREAEYIAGTTDALQRLWTARDEPWIQRHVVAPIKDDLDHSLVLTVNPPTDFLQVVIGYAGGALNWDAATALKELAPVLARVAAAPDAAGYSPDTWETVGKVRGDARVQTLMGAPAIVAAAALAAPDGAVLRGSAAPAVVVVSLLNEQFLRRIAAQLQLGELRVAPAAEPPAGDNFYDLRDPQQNLIARFVWQPNRPAAEIVSSVVPLIGVTLGCFVLLAAFAFSYMRRTTATIAAGENRLRHIAMHDPLSGLPNRLLFGERLEAMIRSIKESGTPAALLSIDLDHFKDVNDTLGHHVGDALISAVAQRLRRTVRDQDVVARLGGDEFAVLTTAATERDQLEALGARIIATLSAPYHVAGHTLVIGASTGIVVIEGHAQDAADVMRFADMALYRAKNEGRNRACIYDAAMNADLTERKQLERDLRLAIESGQLAIVYQPLVTPDGERLLGVEALCRWPHPQRGDIPPAQFIPIAERSELIVPLGEWVLRRACLDGRQWPHMMVAVNVSPIQFRRPDFVEVVQRILAETGFDPARLELELTESTLLGNVEGAENAMHRLRALGVKLALDDFGTGYSSLLYLRTFPFDKLKIDRSFVNNIETAADAAAIVHAIVSLGRGLGMKVTAEGVENADQQLFLRAAGVHCMQGFRFGHPVPPHEISERLNAQPAAATRPAARRAVA
ncbi:MAG TPA: EAL domain-containing protein [Xanthobacteraceae bacterium]